MISQDLIDATQANLSIPAKQWIAGAWVSARDGQTFAVTSPINGATLAHLPRSSATDVDEAVKAARTSFDDGRWSKMPPAGRKKILHKIADLIEQNAAELAVLGSMDNGTEIAMSIKAEPGSAAATFRYYAECVDKINGEIAPTSQNILGLIHREPVGVVGAITPWNFPLMIGAWKIAPALAVGNSVVIKPSEVASLSTLRLGALCAQAGLPDGVLNIITGDGAGAGAAMALHMGIDVLAFTGSAATGRALLQASAASNLKRVFLELGGKSPNILFADYPDLDQAAQVSAAGIFRNSGQVCVAGSRLFVQRNMYDAFVEKFAAAAKAMRVGNPLDLTTQAGAIACQPQLDRIETMVEAAKRSGLELLSGGHRLHADTGGTYFAPTIFTNVSPSHALAQEEVFGPVATVTPFDSEAEAIAMANATPYGLAAGAWTRSLGRAHRMVAGIKAGVVHINTYGGPDITVPLGGHGQSGNGHDKSMHALDKYSNLKTAWINLD